MTPTPDTTARTEKAGETVTVPREKAAQSIADMMDQWYRPQLGENPPPFPADLVARRLSRFALASPQHPVGVREALETYYARQIEWSRQTFGPALRTGGVIDHIRKELCEIEAEPHDLSEWVDVIILAMDGYWRHGGTADDLMPALLAKQAKNMARTWPDWRTMSEHTAIEHDRSGETATLALPPAQDAPGAVKVKALEWGDDNLAETPFGSYTVQDDLDDRWAWTFHCYPYGSPDETTHSTEDEAKAAAQADYERRVLAALSPSPPLPEADGEVVAELRDKAIHDLAEAIKLGQDAFDDDSGPAELAVFRQAFFALDAVEQMLLSERAALVSALRERDEAREELKCSRAEKTQYAGWYLEEKAAREKAERGRDEYRSGWLRAISRVEKAEQVAAGLREKAAEDERDRLFHEANFDCGNTLGLARDRAFYARGWLEMMGGMLPADRAALRASASTEEGKTATPSVKDEEAGR